MAFKSIFQCLYFLLFAVSAWASDTLSVRAEPMIHDDRQLQYLVPTVMEGNEATDRDGLKLSTVFLEIMNTEGTKVTSNCTGIILDYDMILSAGHCLKGDGLKVRVNYGLGGKYGFTHRVMGLGYKSYYPIRQSDGRSLFTNGYLTFDEQSRASYENNIANRRNFVNFADEGIVSRSDFRDLAVIRVPRIPQKYQKVARFNGDLKYRHKVIMAGYGTNSRQEDKNIRQLRWSEGELVGHLTLNQESITMGFQIYSPTRQQSCFGDSGGPLYVQNAKGGFELLAVNSFVFNNCANSNWYMNPNYYMNLINEAIKSLRETIST